MGFRLPVLTTDVDCGPIGYPELVVTFVLNPGYSDHEFPWAGIEDEAARKKERAKILKARPWEMEYYQGLGRLLERVTFPAGMTDGDEAEVAELAGAKSVYDLMTVPGFDQSIITWAVSQYHDKAQERLKAEAKN